MNASNPRLHELPYDQDSSLLFEGIADLDGAVFLDSGFPRNRQGRYDILAAQPFQTLVTRNGITAIRSKQDVSISSKDPFEILQDLLEPRAETFGSLPFCGGAIGYFAYDLARQLEVLPDMTKDLENIPQMIVGFYDWAVVVDHLEQKTWLVSQGRNVETTIQWSNLVNLFIEPRRMHYENQPFVVVDEVVSNMTRTEYGGAFRKIKRYLQDGDCYQVNLAQRFSAHCEGNPWHAYKELRVLNSAPFSGYFNFLEVQILSSSPERFLKVVNRKVETKPIKGTRPRGATEPEDRQQIDELEASLKDLAENLMIVDLLRNDIGKNSKLGSVNVPKLFAIESYATVHHLVSTVCGELAPGRDSIDLLRGCFPGGSITGAPKIRAMEIIEELEPHRRGVYCGSMGYISFNGNMDTNIAIRTLVHSENTIRFWAGGGIVADSQEQAEYDECFDKAAALLKLLERMKFQVP